jgi:hypothetical protein
MKKLVLLFMFLYASILQASINLNWSHKFFGPISHMNFTDVNGDGKKELVAGAQSGIFALNESGEIIWSNFTNTVDDMLLFQYDSDSYPEFAISNGLDVEVYDNNGSKLTEKNMKVSTGIDLPIASLGNKIASYYEGYTSYGIKLTDDWNAFYEVGNVPGHGLASIDSDGDGINDTLFGVADGNVTFSLDKDLNQIWKKEIELSDYDSLSYIWAGKLQNGNFVELISSDDGYLFALDKNGNHLWTQKLDALAGKIIHDKDGGFLIATNFNSSFYPVTQNYIYKINENNGSIEWSYSFDNNVTRAITQDNHKIAASFNGDIKILDENGTISQELNATKLINEINYLFVNSLKYNTLGLKSGLFVGTQDIDRIYDDNKTEKIFNGGTLVREIASGDVNGDGKDEIALRDEYRLYLYDSTGKILWTKAGYNFYDDLRNKNINFADVTGDGKDELIVKSPDLKFTVLDSKGDILWDKDIDPYLVYLYDFNADGAKDIFLAYSENNSENVKVFNGKDGTLLHDYGASEDGTYYMKVLDINGTKRLYYYSDYSMHWIDLNSTFTSKNDITMNYGAILSQYKDFNADGNQDMAMSLEHNSTSTSIYIYDLANNANLIKTINLENQYRIQQIKFFDYNNDGTDEVIVVCNEGVYLYDLSGVLLWKYEMVDQFGDNRALGDVKIVGDQLIVSGKEIYILSKDGQKLQEISTDSYMSEENYFMPTTISKTGENSLQLVFGAMGIYAYDGLNYDTTNLPKITYKANQWHLVATPVDKSISLNQFKDLKIAWKYQDNKWHMYSSSDTVKQKAQELNIEEFSAIVPTQGVWIKNYTDGSISVSGVQNTLPTSLPSSTWSLIGGVKTSVSELHSKYPNADLIYKYTQNGWIGKSYIPDNSLDTLDNIEANEGFWVHVK